MCRSRGAPQPGSQHRRRAVAARDRRAGQADAGGLRTGDLIGYPPATPRNSRRGIPHMEVGGLCCAGLTSGK